MYQQKNQTGASSGKPRRFPAPGFFGLPDLLRHVLLSWLSAAALEYLLLPRELRGLEGLLGLSHMSFPRVLALTALGCVLLSVFARSARSKTLERCGITALFLALSALSLGASFSWPFFAACALSALLLARYSFYGWEGKPEPAGLLSRKAPENNRRICLWITFGFSVLFFLFVCAWTVGRILSFSAPTYDFGIFSQMFYYMKESGLPMTTLERDGLLSHFHVHMSPIYYLLLPFYLLFPLPATLQVFQALILVSSVVPLWKLGRRHGLSGLQQMLLCLSLLLYPAFSGGAGYDLHENCFLTPLLLWLFYGIDQKHTSLILLSAGLTLMVKEDAAVYVAVVALWMLVKALLQKGTIQETNAAPVKALNKTLLTGSLMLLTALLWFFLATGYLAGIGDGVMTGRYENFLYGGSSSLLTVVKAVILQPMKALYECADPEKLSFIAMTLLPLLGLPLLTRRYERYLLLIPYILVNLMSDYPYQHDIFFQYTFGSSACLFYLTVVNLADLKADGFQGPSDGQNRPSSFSPAATALLFAAAAVGAFCFGAKVFPRAVTYPVKSIQEQSRYQRIRDTLSRIPDDASVTASTFYTAYLFQRKLLYDVQYASLKHLLDTDYIVLDPSLESSFKKYAAGGEANGLEGLILLLEEHGYERWAECEDVIIYRRKEPGITPGSSP